MSPSFREQISINIRDTENRLNFLRTQSKPDPTVIEGEQKELEILKRKLSGLPSETAEPALTH